MITNLIVPVYGKKTNVFFYFLIVIYFILGCYLRFETLEISRLNEWLTRDFDRAFNLFDGIYIPLAGPETSGGGRLPGPLLYFILSIPLFFKYSYESIFFFHFLINISSIVILFFIVKRFFGLSTSFLAVAFFSIDLAHVDAVAFPINPVFIFPFIILFLGYLLEFSLKRNEKLLPVMFLLISLAIQIHYSVITYYPVLIFSILIFKTKISKKTLLYIGLTLTVTFSPYIVHKITVFEPEIKIENKFFKGELNSFADLVNLVTVHTTLKRIAHDIGAEPMFGTTSSLSRVRLIVISVTFYMLIIYIFIKRFKNRNLRCGQEGVILLLFYIPSLIYEITSPIVSHVWYTYIFIPPVIVIVSRAIIITYEIISPKFLKRVSLLLFGLFLAVATIFALDRFHVFKNQIRSQLELGNPGLSYKNLHLLKKLIAHLFTELGLNAKSYSERVFMEGISPQSLKLLEFTDHENKQLSKSTSNIAISDCFYIIQSNRLVILNKEGFSKLPVEQRIESFRLTALMTDPTIKISSYIREIIFQHNNLSKYFTVFKYRPKKNQICYTNSRNIFSVSKKTRDLLIQSNGMDKADQLVVVKEISDKGINNGHMVLKKNNLVFLVFDKNLNTPFRIEIKTQRKGSNHLFKVGLEFYSFVQDSGEVFNINDLEIGISKLNKGSNGDFKEKRLKIITPKSWISKYTSNHFDNTYTNHLKWEKIFNLKSSFDMENDNFHLTLYWSFQFPNKTKNEAGRLYSNQVILMG